MTELDMYKLLVENVQDYAIFFMDRDGYIQTWNKGAQNTKGYTSKDIIGQHFSIFYSPEDIKDQKPQKELEIAKKIGRVEDEDWRIRKDGSRFWANVIITALYDNSGKLQGFAKVTRNLTERKEHEDSLRKANILLQEQQNTLQKLNESKDEFISLASHQLRTPASTIKQLLGLLLEGFEGTLPINISEIIQKAYEINDRQIMIVNSMLRVAQIDSGKVVLNKQWLDLNEILRGVEKQYRGVINDRGQTVDLSLQKAPLTIIADEHYLRMAIENIIDNASKYTNSGGKIQLKSKTTNDYAHIIIKDSGVGINKQDIPVLFEKFQRIPNDLSHKVAGSGLGLYWAEKVISFHGGKIKVESELGKGTSFHVYLPKERADA